VTFIDRPESNHRNVHRKDETAYANDEYTQFMGGELVNGPGFFVRSYDGGAALEWEAGRWFFARRVD